MRKFGRMNWQRYKDENKLYENTPEAVSWQRVIEEKRWTENA